MTQINDVAVAKVQPSYFSKYWCTGIWTYVQSCDWLPFLRYGAHVPSVHGSSAINIHFIYTTLIYSKGSLYFVCFHIGVTYQTSVIENCSEADWDEVG